MRQRSCARVQICNLERLLPTEVSERPVDSRDLLGLLQAYSTLADRARDAPLAARDRHNNGQGDPKQRARLAMEMSESQEGAGSPFVEKPLQATAWEEPTTSEHGHPSENRLSLTDWVAAFPGPKPNACCECQQCNRAVEPFAVAGRPFGYHAARDTSSRSR